MFCALCGKRIPWALGQPSEGFCCTAHRLEYYRQARRGLQISQRLAGFKVSSKELPLPGCSSGAVRLGRPTLRMPPIWLAPVRKQGLSLPPADPPSFVRPAVLGAGRTREPVAALARSKSNAASDPASLTRFFERPTLYLESERAIEPSCQKRAPGPAERINWLQYRVRTVLPAHPDGSGIEGLEASQHLILRRPQSDAGRTVAMRRTEPAGAHRKCPPRDSRFVASVTAGLELANPRVALTDEYVAASTFDVAAQLLPVRRAAGAPREEAWSLGYAALAAPVSTPFAISNGLVALPFENASAADASIHPSDLPWPSPPKLSFLERGSTPMVGAISAPEVPSSTRPAFSCLLATPASLNLSETGSHMRPDRSIRWQAFHDATFRGSAGLSARDQRAPEILPDILHLPPRPLAASTPACGYLPDLAELQPPMTEPSRLAAPVPYDRGFEALELADAQDTRAFEMPPAVVWSGAISTLGLGLSHAEIDRSAAGPTPETPAVVRSRAQAFLPRPAPQISVLTPFISEVLHSPPAPVPADRRTPLLESESAAIPSKRQPTIDGYPEIAGPLIKERDIDRSAIRPAPDSPESLVFRSPVQVSLLPPVAPDSGAPFISKVPFPPQPPAPAARGVALLESASAAMPSKMQPAIAGNTAIARPLIRQRDVDRSAMTPAPDSPECLVFRSPVQVYLLPPVAPDSGAPFISEVPFPPQPPLPAGPGTSLFAGESAAKLFQMAPAVTASFGIDAPELWEAGIYRAALGQPPDSPAFAMLWSRSAQGFQLPAPASHPCPPQSVAMRSLAAPVPADGVSESLALGEEFGAKGFDRAPAVIWTGRIGEPALDRVDLNRASIGQWPDSPAAKMFQSRRTTGFMPQFAPLNPGPAQFVGFVPRPAAPAASEGRDTAYQRTPSLYFASTRGLSRSRHLRVEAPLSGFAAVGPRPVVENSSLLELGESLVRPKWGSTPRQRLEWLKASKPALRWSHESAPLGYRFQRKRKPWDRTARWAKPHIRALPRVASPRWRFLSTEHDWSYGTRYQ